MKPSTAALALLLCAHLPTTWAQGTCSSDGAPAPRALYERFLPADCADCWGEPGFAPGPGAAVLDWIAPAATGDEAALSAAARTESLTRLQALERPVPATTDVHVAPMGARLPGRLRLALGPAVNDYVGASLSYHGALPRGARGPWTVWLVLVEQVPAGAEGTRVPRNLVRNMLQRSWTLEEQLSKNEQFNLPRDTRWSERPTLQLPAGAQPERLALIGWMEDAAGQVVATAQASCAPPAQASKTLTAAQHAARP